MMSSAEVESPVDSQVLERVRLEGKIHIVAAVKGVACSEECESSQETKRASRPA